MKYLISSIVILAIFVSCSCKQEKESCQRINLHADVKNIINTYIKEHPQFNTFILKSVQGLEQNESIAIKRGFLFGPGYELLVKECHSSSYFDISKRIFYISPSDELREQEENKWVINNGADSMIISNDWTIKNSWELFIYRSIYFYHNKSGYLEVNLRPDTIFSPPILKETIKFENLK
jgi:hypothetical protein